MAILGGIIIGTLIGVFTNTTNALNQVITFFTQLFELIKTTMEFIPEPFLTITILFLPVLMAALFYKILKG